MSETVIKIAGMSCNHCKMAVEKALKKVAGVDKAVVDLAKKEALVGGSADRESLVKAIDEAGYTVID